MTPGDRRESCEIIELAEDIADKALWDLNVRRPMALIHEAAQACRQEPEVMTDE